MVIGPGADLSAGDHPAFSLLLLRRRSHADLDGPDDEATSCPASRQQRPAEMEFVRFGVGESGNTGGQFVLRHRIDV